MTYDSGRGQNDLMIFEEFRDSRQLFIKLIDKPPFYDILPINQAKPWVIKGRKIYGTWIYITTPVVSTPQVGRIAGLSHRNGCTAAIRPFCFGQGEKSS